MSAGGREGCTSDSIQTFRVLFSGDCEEARASPYPGFHLSNRFLLDARDVSPPATQNGGSSSSGNRSAGTYPSEDAPAYGCE
jgi:hypothetical protein